MKILHWDEMFHPLFGYQINILPAYQAKQGHDVTIVAPEKPETHPMFVNFCNADSDIEKADREYTERTGVKIIRVPKYGVISGRVIYKPGYLSIINQLKPDVILCHFSDTLASMTIARHHKKINAPLVFDNHMLEMASHNRLRNLFRIYYRHRITPIFKKEGFITIRTQDDPYVMKCLGIPEELAPYISFGTDTDLFVPDEAVRRQFRQAHQIPEDAFVVVYAGKLSAAKGGQILADALQKKFHGQRDIVFLVIGNMEKTEYGQQIQETFARSENKILFFPTQNYRDLAQFYQAADLALYPKQCSLSFFDVQACGLPVILEDGHVNRNRVQNGNGLVYAQGDTADFIEKIQTCIDMDPAEIRAMGENARTMIMEQFDYNTVARQYTEILERERIRQNRRKGNGA